jgi:hypothetical protein
MVEIAETCVGTTSVTEDQTAGGTVARAKVAAAVAAAERDGAKEKVAAKVKAAE